MPLDPDIAMLVVEIDANLSHAESIAHGLTREQWHWRPAPDQWSIGQCFAHLNLANSFALRAIEPGIANGRVSGKTGQGPFQYGFLSRKFIASQEPPGKKNFTAPKRFLPPAEIDPGATLAEYRRISTELKRLTRDADGLHLARVRVKMPALPERFLSTSFRGVCRCVAQQILPRIEVLIRYLKPLDHVTNL